MSREQFHTYAKSFQDASVKFMQQFYDSLKNHGLEVAMEQLFKLIDKDMDLALEDAFEKGQEYHTHPILMSFLLHDLVKSPIMMLLDEKQSILLALANETSRLRVIQVSNRYYNENLKDS